jgi:carbon storage regulator
MAMLNLTRKVGQSIVIGGNIVVKVLDIQGRQVQLGIEAPKDVPIERPEASGEKAKKPG